MKTSILSSLIAAIAVADKKDFPSSDLFHADCHLKSQIQLIYCDEVYPMVLKEIQTWGDATLTPAGGLFDIVETQRDKYDDQDYIWSTRRSVDGDTMHDMMIEFKNMKNGCVIKGHSRS